MKLPSPCRSNCYGFDATAVNILLAALERDGRAHLSAAGVADTDIRIERSADMRLVGQMHDIAVALPAGTIGIGSLETIRAAFRTVYEARYTSVYDGARIEAVSFRVRCIGPQPTLSLRGATGGVDGKRKCNLSPYHAELPSQHSLTLCHDPQCAKRLQDLRKTALVRTEWRHTGRRTGHRR